MKKLIQISNVNLSTPKIRSITPLKDRQLLVTFANGTEKRYDCGQLFYLPQFQLIQNEAFFKTVKVDPGGYGISWNDELDLSEDELWLNGKEISGFS
jgi:hypothetical protein